MAGAPGTGPTLRYGYVTNGLAQHRLDDALRWLSDLGYAGVAITLDPHHLDPYAADLGARVARLARRLRDLGLGVVLETGAGYLLDPRRKHEPTLLSTSREGRERRVDLLWRAVAIAADLGAEAVSFWAGRVPAGVSRDEAWARLLGGCEAVLIAADRQGVTLGFEPEPGMLVDRLDGYDELLAALGHPDRLGLTLDIGHCRCLEAEPVPDCIARAAPRLVNVHIEDMRRGVHEHLDFGEGEIELPPVLGALRAAGYTGLVSVELSRHSHAAEVVVPRSLRILRGAEQQAAEQAPAAAGTASGVSRNVRRVIGESASSLARTDDEGLAELVRGEATPPAAKLAGDNRRGVARHPARGQP